MSHKRRKRRVRPIIKFTIFLLLMSVTYFWWRATSKNAFSEEPIQDTQSLAEKENEKPVEESSLQRKSVDPSSYQAKAFYVLDVAENSVLFAKNADERLAPASLTKIMTVYLALQHIENIAAICPVDVDIYQEMLDKNASMAGFDEGEETSYRDLLYGTMLASGGECANSLALQLAGSLHDFSEWMNQEAQKLGLRNTHFSNPEGLDDPELYSSAADLAMLLKRALQDGNFRAIFTCDAYLSTFTPQHPDGLWVESTVMKKLANYPQETFTILGGKSGTTGEAGLCWATLAEKNGKEYIVVVMGVPFQEIENPGEEHIQETLRLLKEI